MTVRDDMLNGHDICHGGFITTLADSAFAFACNSYNELTVASGFAVDFLAPARLGDVLTAAAPRSRRPAAPASTTSRSPTSAATSRSRPRAAAARSRSRAEPVDRRPAPAAGPDHREETHMPVKRPAARRPRADRDAPAATRSQALQLRAPALDPAARLRQRAALPQGLRRQGRAPGRPEARSPTWRASRSPSRTTCATTIRSACSRCRASRWRASTPRPAPPASRRSSATRCDDIDTWADLVARSIRAAGGRPRRHGPRRLRLRPVHRRPRRALRRRARRLHGDPDVGRADREAGPADQRLQARHHHGHALLHAGAHRGVRAPGARPAVDLARGRHLRRRAVDRGDAPARSRPAPASTRSTSTACRK